MLKINTHPGSHRRLQEQLALVRTTPKGRKYIHQWVGRQVITKSRARVKRQEDLDGRHFKARQYNSKKRLLKKLLKGNNIKAYVGANKATVTWPNSRTGSIARGQQEGFKESFTKRDLQKGQPDYSAPATDAQAKALIQKGYKRYVGRYKGGKKKGQARQRRVSKAWIKENMTLGQAGLVLRMMRENTQNPDQLPPSKSAWVVEVPERPFFGLSDKEAHDMGKELFDERLTKIKQAKG